MPCLLCPWEFDALGFLMEIRRYSFFLFGPDLFHLAQRHPCSFYHSPIDGRSSCFLEAGFTHMCEYVKCVFVFFIHLSVAEHSACCFLYVVATRINPMVNTTLLQDTNFLSFGHKRTHSTVMLGDWFRGISMFPIMLFRFMFCQ